MSRSKKGNSRAGSENGEDTARTAAERAARLDAVRRAMMEELGIGRVESLPLTDRYDPAEGAHTIRTLDPDSRWNLQDTASSGPQAIADGQLYRLRREAERSMNVSSASSNSQGLRSNHGLPVRGQNASSMQRKIAGNYDSGSNGASSQSGPAHSVNDRRQARHSVQPPERIDMNLQFLRKLPSDFKAPPTQATKQHRNRSNRSITSKPSSARAQRVPVTASGTRWDLSNQSTNAAPHHGTKFLSQPRREPPTPVATATSSPTVSTATQAPAATTTISKHDGGQLQQSRWATKLNATTSETKQTSRSSQPSIFNQADVFRASAQARVKADGSSRASVNSPQHTRNEIACSLPNTKPSSEPQTAVDDISKPTSPDAEIKQRHALLRRDGITVRIKYRVYLKKGQFRALQTTRVDTSPDVDIDDEITSATFAKVNPDEPKEVVYRSNNGMAVWTIVLGMPTDAEAFVQLLLLKVPASQMYMNAQDREQLWPSNRQVVGNIPRQATHNSEQEANQIDLLQSTNQNHTLLDIDGPLLAGACGNTSRISARTFTDLMDMQEGHAPLIDIEGSDHPEQMEMAPTEGRRATMDLALDLSPLDIFHAIERHESSFLERVLALATDVTMHSSLDEILDSDEALQAADFLVFQYFGNSKLFNELLEPAEQLEFSSILSPDILTEAIKARDRVPRQQTIQNLLGYRGSASPREELHFNYTPTFQTDEVALRESSESTTPQLQEIESAREHLSQNDLIGLPYDDIVVTQHTNIIQQGSSPNTMTTLACVGQHAPSILNNTIDPARTRQSAEPNAVGASQVPSSRRIHHAVTNSEVERLSEQLGKQLRVSSGEVAITSDKVPDDADQVQASGMARAEATEAVVNATISSISADESASLASQTHERAIGEVVVETSLETDSVQSTSKERVKRGLEALSKSKYAPDAAPTVAAPAKRFTQGPSSTTHDRRQPHYNPGTAPAIIQDTVMREFITRNSLTGEMEHHVGYEVVRPTPRMPYMSSGNSYNQQAYTSNGYAVDQSLHSEPGYTGVQSRFQVPQVITYIENPQNAHGHTQFESPQQENSMQTLVQQRLNASFAARLKNPR